MQTLSTINTPALVLDRGIAARNMARMQGVHVSSVSPPPNNEEETAKSPPAASCASMAAPSLPPPLAAPNRNQLKFPAPTTTADRAPTILAPYSDIFVTTSPRCDAQALAARVGTSPRLWS